MVALEMRWTLRTRVRIVVLGILIGAPAAVIGEPSADHADHAHVLPVHRIDGRAPDGWQDVEGWRHAAPLAARDGSGSRVAAWIEVAASAPTLRIEARGLDGARTGRWQPLEETYRSLERRVAIADLDGRWPAAELRVAAASHAELDAIAWELITPAYPDAGRRARAAASSDHARAAATLFEPRLVDVGVVPRTTWGARPTGCTATEDDWYRMAIHHTAQSPSIGGSVVEAVKALQAFAQDSGNFCDIPYQFLVGYDGSLYEGRPYGLYSGATGGGNNDGNLAVCFLGCYQPTNCPAGVTPAMVTDAMMRRGQLLVQTLVRLHDISTAPTNIMGHRDWPGNNTACPGDSLYARLDELRSDLAWYAGREVGRSTGGAIELELPTGADAEVWIDVLNTGGMTWNPGETFLAPTPRDQPSALAHPSWPSPTQAATIVAPVAPGEIGRFAFTVRLAAAATVMQGFGLVADDSWFADAPWGGGPADSAIQLTVVASDVPLCPHGTECDGGGCCNSGGGLPTSGIALFSVALFALRRRRGRGRS